MRVIRFEVYGAQKPQGSKIAHPIRRKGGGFVTDANGRPITIVREDNPDTVSWRQEVAAQARKAYSGEPILGAVRLEIGFVRPRPSSHFRTGKNAMVLKASAPARPTTKPDLTKTIRSVEDALSGVCWRDDSQVVEMGIEKRYGDTYLTVVTVTELEA